MTEINTAPWKQQPPCNICNEQHAGYERAHTATGDRTDYSANFDAARELAECRSHIIPSISAGADATNDYWRGRADTLERAIIAKGLQDETEFQQWYDAEIAGYAERRMTTRGIANLAFHQGLALGREGRA